MKKRALWIIFLIVFLVSFGFFLYDGLLLSLTGRQVFLDDEFEKSASDFAGQYDEPLLNSPNDCEIMLISSSHSVAKVGRNISIYVDGIGCIDQELDVKIFENDYFFDDYVDAVSGTFTRNRLTLDWIVTDEFVDLLDERFEGDALEIYFRVDYANLKFESRPLKFYLADTDLEEDLALSPIEEQPGAKIIFYIVLITLVSSMLVVIVLIIRFARFNSRFVDIQ